MVIIINKLLIYNIFLIVQKMINLTQALIDSSNKAVKRQVIHSVIHR